MVKIKRFSQNKEGVAAIEFALVAAPFLALLFAVIEIAAVFWANGLLIEAVQSPARSVLVGDKIDREKFRDLICSQVKVMMNCKELIIDVSSYSSFSDIKPQSLIDSVSGKANAGNFDQGKGGDIVVVRVGYAWPLMVPILHNITFNLSTLAGNRRLIQATNVFKNEPYNE